MLAEIKLNPAAIIGFFRSCFFDLYIVNNDFFFLCKEIHCRDMKGSFAFWRLASS